MYFESYDLKMFLDDTSSVMESIYASLDASKQLSKRAVFELGVA